MRLFLKRIAENIPYIPGKYLSHIPYRIRLGSDYSRFTHQQSLMQKASPEVRLRYTLLQLRKIVNFAQQNIPFYQRLYGKTPIDFQSINDFEKLPHITKNDVRAYTKESTGAMRLNTGGSTDGPLNFYIDKNAWAREWAHMHFIWALRGYKHSDLMITMLGKPIGNQAFRYNPVHNEFLLNPYVDAGKHIEILLPFFKKYPFKYFQGYPSTIYNFLKEIEPFISSTEKELISQKIRSLFFSSEYPMPYMLDYIKDNWNITDYISWYGHSEMCILAYDEFSKGEYRPFVTYGYAEEAGGMLLGTSFHNYDMPLIRYSTEDLVVADKNEYGIVEKFRIERGRSGDFIEDINGRMFALTFFLGRHHRIYDYADFVQVYQPERGKIIYYITFKRSTPISKQSVSEYFDFPNIVMSFDYVFLKEPIRTQRGKLKLKLSEQDILSISTPVKD